ncbi:MAG: glycosyltransferase WbuB [Calditrichaeota bacterium]|nr:MAG: glycosyltransferase WbuB [Calditrichota bacterium]
MANNTTGKKILMLLENNPYPHDGRVRREAKTLIAAGHHVSIISPGRKHQPWKETIDNVHAFRYPEPVQADGFLGYIWEYSYSMLASFFLSLYVFFNRGFDVIHAHNPPDTFVFIAAFYKIFGKQFVFDHHDLSPEMYYARFSGEGNKIVYKALLAIEKMTFRFADHVIATNESYKEIAVTRGKVDKEKVSIVRNGPELKRLRLSEPDQELQAMGKTIIGFVGDMGYHDGVDNLIRAIHCLVTELGRTDFYCVIIGEGDAWEDMKKLTTKLKLDTYVRFTGFIPDADMLRYLSTADICVDPDPKNDFTNRSTMIKMMEYMALAKPIVAFRLKEHTVTALEAASYAQPNDPADLARCIAELMDNPEQRQKMGKIGRKRIETELAWQFQEPNLVTAYESL